MAVSVITYNIVKKQTETEMISYSLFESGTAEAEKLIANFAKVEDREYAERKKNPQGRHNSLLARAVLRGILKIDGEILIAEGGKPYIKDGPNISISHSEKMVACTVCEEHQIGIDIEFWRERDFLKLADYAFGPLEIQQVKNIGEKEFYRVWTLREAISKITGESMFRGMTGKDVDFGKWQVFSEVPKAYYSLALAVDGLGLEIKRV